MLTKDISSLILENAISHKETLSDDGSLTGQGAPVVRGAGSGAVAICVGMIPALSSGINLSDHAARSMI